MEKIRDDIKKNVSNREMFEIDNNIYQLTEKKIDTMVAKHEKRLKSLRNVPAIRSESPGKGKKKKYQSRSMKVTTSKAKSLQIEKNNRNPSKQKKAVAPNNSAEINTKVMNRHGKPKIDSMCPKVVQSEKNSENQNASKNEVAPGTNKTYSEAVKNGAILLQQTVENFVKTMSKVTNLLPLSRNLNKGALFESKTKISGGKQRKDFQKYKKGKTQS